MSFKKKALILSAFLLIAATTTSNMSLLIPDFGDSDYATSFSTSLGLIDSHDHTSGKGVQIPTAGLRTNAITTAKINPSSVTRVKRAAVNIATSTTVTDPGLPNPTRTMTVAIASSGRPLIVGLTAIDGSAPCSISLNTPEALGGLFAIELDDLTGPVVIGTQDINLGNVSDNVTPVNSIFPCSAVKFFVVPADTASHSYKLSVTVFVGFSTATFNINNAKLYAYELE